ncbi:ATP-binding domain-containing protein [Kitasatospora sp. NBC_01250]|uniref:ATP-binding domain-containing protein n=1 Tax=Kitasatospora sp. NBC_01250 TaxID=2903571 RepID=UPI002E2FB65E|nr:ATP-binding domain-containing protein [Kitasatospora sp. NBC_01250]
MSQTQDPGEGPQETEPEARTAAEAAPGAAPEAAPEVAPGVAGAEAAGAGAVTGADAVAGAEGRVEAVPEPRSEAVPAAAGAEAGGAEAGGGADGGAADGGARRAAEVAALAEAIRTIGGGAGGAGSAGRAGSGDGAGSGGGAGSGAAGGAGSAPVAASDEARAAALRAVGEVLTAGGAPAPAVAALASAALTAFGEGAGEALRADPWALLALPGVRPEQADGFARALLGQQAGPGDPRRGQALAVWLLEQAAVRGHSALEADELQAGLAKLGLPEPEQALQEAVLDGRVMPFQEEETDPGAHSAAEDAEPPVRMLLALERLALAEDSAADGLVRIMSTFEPPVPEAAGGDDAAEGATGEEAAGEGAAGEGATGEEPVDEGAAGELVPARPSAEAWEAAAAAAPSSSAAALLRAVAANPLVLHTGDAAARAELAALLAAARGLGLRAWAAAWSEHGRDALTELLPAGTATGSAPSLTLAELLGGAGPAVPVGNAPGRADDGSLAVDLLIVQDAPLLDLELAATLVEALADGTRLVLSGDPGQLWSAGPGRLFADLLAAKACPVVASRTPDLSPIGELVSGIGIGELQSVEAPDKEVVILTARGAGEAVHRAVQLLTDSIPRALGIPAEQTVLLTPGHGGEAGTRALNSAAKAQLNPGPGRFAGFDPGDRVVYSPLPGVNRPGSVLGGEAAGLRLALADGEELLLPPTQVDRLRHGWALTAHQAVGRRWPGVVVVLPEDAAAALTRQWVYTAFSRAERHLSVVHAAGPALAQAVAERPAAARTTRLRAILAEHTEQAY